MRGRKIKRRSRTSKLLVYTASSEMDVGKSFYGRTRSRGYCHELWHVNVIVKHREKKETIHSTDISFPERI